jgi:very-short-patch-repair endonuclease
MSDPVMLERARRMRKEPSEAERKFWYGVRDRRLCGHKFRRQVWIGPYIADFLCEKKQLIVEIDGGQHEEQKEYDGARTVWLQKHGYRVLRFWSNEVLAAPDAVLEAVRVAIEA